MNIFDQIEKGKYKHNCLNCRTNFCANKPYDQCPFCESTAIVILNPEED